MKIVPFIAAMLTTMAAGSASAAVTVRSVAIENASFEDGKLADGAYFRTSIPGWTATGSGVGYYNPAADAGFNATDGDVVVNLDTFRQGGTTDSTYIQLLSELIAADTTYTLSVDAIRRDDVDIGPWFAEIVAVQKGQYQNAMTLAKGTVQDADVAPGTFKTLTFGYTGTTLTEGQQLGIRFRSVYDPVQTPIRQVLLDNVRMTAAAPLVAAVPEPATWAMMLVGFGMIGLSARRRGSTKAVIA